MPSDRYRGMVPAACIAEPAASDIRSRISARVEGPARPTGGAETTEIVIDRHIAFALSPVVLDDVAIAAARAGCGCAARRRTRPQPGGSRRAPRLPERTSP